MKKSLLALALFGAFAGVAHAQSSVQIYGTLDAGVLKSTGKTAAVGKHDTNKLGFKGTEDLGNGLKALFQLEMRFESDTGLVEQGAGASRPLFQGQSRVGLQGAFGTVRLGRGLTAFQESSTAFEPWAGMPSAAGFQSDLHTAGYNSDPLGGAVSSKNRFNNAVFYNTPVFNGFQVNGTVASKEDVGSQEVPYSLSGTYNNGPIGAMLAYERNAIDTTVWSVAASFNPLKDLKLMASYTAQDQGATVPAAPDTKSWVLGANYTIGSGLIRAGYGQKDADTSATKTKQASLGYEYNLSKRTYVYAEASQKKTAAKVNYYGVGLHHNF